MKASTKIDHLDNNEAPTYFCSNVKITRIGRLFKPPGHELKHINWNMLVTKSLPAAKCKSREDGMGINMRGTVHENHNHRFYV